MANLVQNLLANNTQPQYSDEMQAYLNDLENQEYFKKLLNQAPQMALTSDQYKQGIMQGLNYGVPEIAQAQQKLGIRIPVTNEDKYNASVGQFNQYPVINAGVSAKPSVLDDFATGYNENYNNRFNVANLQPSKKTWATRIGEGLGTVGRLVDSPLGRGLLAAGLNSALGYNNSLQEGLQGYVGRQNAQTQDRIYRQQLAAQGIDTSNVEGNIDNSIYRQLLYGQQLKDNAEYRNLYLQNQQKQQEALQQLRQDQLEYQKQKAKEDRADRAAQRALTKRGQDLNYSLGKERLKNKDTQDKTLMRTLNDNSQTLADIEAGLQLIEEHPNAYSWVKGKLGADVANRLDPKGVATRTQIDNITAVYRKWLTGAQMSDAERKAYERFLPAPTDNYNIIKAKLNGMKNSIERKNQIIMQGAKNQQDNDPLGIL